VQAIQVAILGTCEKPAQVAGILFPITSVSSRRSSLISTVSASPLEKADPQICIVSGNYQPNYDIRFLRWQGHNCFLFLPETYPHFNVDLPCLGDASGLVIE
jgi:hypothetical protein